LYILATFNLGNLKHILLVFLGGGIGSALRFAISKWLNNNSYHLPFGTFTVNILGSFLIGFLIGMANKNNLLNEQQTLLLISGFCGGFTTFSAFAFENFNFIKTGDYSSLILYTIGSIVVGILAVFLGFLLAK
jgi:CrcB protein